MTGLLRDMMRSAATELSYRSSAARLNLSFSCASRTNALTTRMAPTFSLMTALITSYLRNICLK